jgi:nucleolar GTP-binding protein
MSVETGEGTAAALDAALDAVTYEPDIPPSRRE